MEIDSLGRTTMYSYNKDGSIVRHRLALSPKNIEKTQRYLNRGYTYERPEESSVEVAEVKAEGTPLEFICDVCNKGFGSKIALLGHSRTHK